MYVYALKTDELAILDLLKGMSKKYDKKYCYPAQETILELLKKFHGIVMSIRTLNRRLAKLQKMGLIRRIRRLTRSAWTSSAYYVCDRVGVASARVKKILGCSKRLAPIYPSQLPKLADNKINTKSRFVSGGPKSPPAAPVETLRCEASDLRKDLCAPGPCEKPQEGKEPGDGSAARSLMDWIRSKDKSRLLKKP